MLGDRFGKSCSCVTEGPCWFHLHSCSWSCYTAGYSNADPHRVCDLLVLGNYAFSLGIVAHLFVWHRTTATKLYFTTTNYQGLHCTRMSKTAWIMSCRFGDKDLQLELANPLHLRAVLEHSTFAQCRVVLLHGSYPFMREASYLAGVYPQVQD